MEARDEKMQGEGMLRSLVKGAGKRAKVKKSKMECGGGRRK